MTTRTLRKCFILVHLKERLSWHWLAATLYRCGTTILWRFQGRVVGRIMVPQDVHALIPGNIIYITPQGKRDFANEMKFIDLKIYYPRLSGGPNVITWAFQSGRGRQKWQRCTRGRGKRKDAEAGEGLDLCLLAALTMEERDHEVGNLGGPTRRGCTSPQPVKKQGPGMRPC